MRVARLASVALLLLAACFGAEPLERPTAIIPPKPPPKNDSGELVLEELLNVHRVSSPIALSDDELLFLSDATGTLGLERGSARDRLAQVPLTNLPDGIADVKLSPSRKDVAFLESHGDDNDQIRVLALTPAGDAKPALVAPAPAVKHTSPCWSPDGSRIAFTSNARNGKDMDLYVAPISPSAGAKLEPLIELAGNWTALDWKQSSILIREEISTMSQRLALIDARTGKKTDLAIAKGDARIVAARLSGDARTVVALSDRAKDIVGLIALDIASSKVTPILEDAREALDFDVVEAGDSATACVVVAAGDHDSLVVLSLEAWSVKHRSDVDLDGIASGLSIAPGGKTAFVALTRPDLPGEAHKVDLASGRVAVVTDSDHGGIDMHALVRAEPLHVKSFDGLPIPVDWYARRGKGDARHPLVVLLHGGPDQQARPNWKPLIQYLVSKGYAVAEPNVRGSSGYGRAYMALDDREKREDSLRDVEEIGRALAARSDVDPSKMALWGQSYGGYLVLASLAKYPDRWAAGVDFFGISDFENYLKKTANYRRAQREVEYGSLAKDTALLARLSPIHHMSEVRAPLLLVHGKRDAKVDFDEALNVVTALERQGKTVVMLAFDDMGHGLTTRRSRLVAFPEVAAFLDRYVRRVVVKDAPLLLEEGR